MSKPSHEGSGLHSDMPAKEALAALARAENKERRALPSGMLAASASKAVTALQYERLVRGLSIETVSKRTNISTFRLERLETGLTTTLLPGEAAALRKQFHEPAEALLQKREAGK